MSTPETNPRLQFFRSMIGQAMAQSPSPLGRWLNGRLLAAEEGSLTVEYEVREDMTNPTRILHGGAASAIIDELIGTTVYALGREHLYTSVNLNVDFLHSARLGETVTARTQVVRAGKNIVHAECQITAADGKIIAKASSNLIQTSVKH
ncbi:PaaI family thioesterase [Larkinella humicola]|uniref:PaaI family thioesterase n=1 Tax=Larkinella humicola TaxID=2607654 RepID=A0A5N1JGI7_9BACT|nr:PaaI family thioesterase [Larkinella humicola]KAA9353607.1 PaaI family thioesterase [Larkinella humicola]